MNLDQKFTTIFCSGENITLNEEVYNSIKNEFENIQIEGNITKVNFSNSLTIVTLDDKLNVIFANDSNLEYKVSFLKGILQKNEQIVEGTIDMSIEDPVYSKYN